MFCVQCGSEIDKDAHFCPECGRNINKNHKKPLQEVNKEFKEDSKPKIYEKPQFNREKEDLDTKIKNLVDLISVLQDENKQLKKELEKYYLKPSTLSAEKTEFIRKKMPKQDKEEKDNLFSRFKKWYNE